MRVLMVGKSRYRDRPGVAKFLEMGTALGHRVELWDRDETLAVDPARAGFDVVLAKSHHSDGQVDRWLRTTVATVVNSPASNAVCRSRRDLDQTLSRAGVPTPQAIDITALESPEPPPGGTRMVAKPDNSGLHDVVIFDPAAGSGPSIDPTKFVQAYLEPDETVKVYVFGALRFAQRLDYPTVDTVIDLRVKPHRVDLGPLDGSVDGIVSRVAQATGLQVFNVDLVLSQGSWHVVDVNPFPSLERVPQAAEALWDLIETIGRRHDQFG